VAELVVVAVVVASASAWGGTEDHLGVEASSLQAVICSR
jgi:hypothetical protein